MMFQLFPKPIQIISAWKKETNDPTLCYHVLKNTLLICIFPYHNVGYILYEGLRVNLGPTGLGVFQWLNGPMQRARQEARSVGCSSFFLLD
jgi:hypothetical protein